MPGERLEDQGDRGQALLAVIDHKGRPVGVEGIDGGDVHDGSEEVLAHVPALAGVEDVVPELAAMPLRVQAYLRWLTGMRNCGDCRMKSRRRVSEVRMGCSGSVGRGQGPLRATRDRAPPNAPRDSWRCESTSSEHRRCLANDATFVGIEHGMRDARNDRERTSGYTSESSSAPFNGKNAGTTTCISSSRNSRPSGRNRRWLLIGAPIRRRSAR